MKRLGIAAVVVLMVAGCGGGGGGERDQPEPKGSPSAEASETADPFAYNVGDLALKVGETRKGSEVTTTLEKVEHPYPPGEYREPEAGNEFVGLRLKQCIIDKPSEATESTYNGDWSAVTPDGEEYSGNGSSWDDWPSPKFPELVEMIPGRCLKGWIALEVPEGTKFDRLIYRPGGTPVAEWLLE
jgi:hypothetical protein